MTSPAEAPRPIKDIQRDLNKARRNQAWEGTKRIAGFVTPFPIFAVSCLTAYLLKSGAPLVGVGYAAWVFSGPYTEGGYDYRESRAKKLHYKEELLKAKSQAIGK